MVVLTGPPGSGKTTVAPLVAGRAPAAVCLESDWFWTTIVRGFVPPWERAAHRQNSVVVRAFTSAAAELAAGGYLVVLEGIVGPWFLDAVRHELRRRSVDGHYVVLRPPLEVSLERVRLRHGEARVAGHPALADPEPVRQLWEQLSDLGSLEPHVVDNGELTAEETAGVVWEGLLAGRFRLG